MTRRHLLTALTGTLALPAFAHADSGENSFSTLPDAAAPSFPSGKGGFAYTEPPGSPYAGVRIAVHTYCPINIDPRLTDRVLFVMHGTLRNGGTYRDQWMNLAERHGALILVPEFTSEHFGGGMYNRGNVRGKDDKTPVPSQAWTFPIIERLFAYYKTIARNPVRGYYIYGHSAGGQFVHRLIEFLPTARIVRAVAANAGYYTLPDKTEDPYPFSRTGTPDESEAARRTIFAQPLTILLGEADTDPNDPDLYRGAEVDKQGITRLERGKYFYETAKRVTERDQLFLNWKLVTVPGVGHSNEKMAPAAAKVLFE